ncbi:MAG: TIGR00730 family Rossman fold protein [bacterium]
MSQTYPIENITVYCSSSNHVDDVYLGAAREMGRVIAEQGYTLVFGGGQVGLMREVSAGARENGGKVVGIILQKFLDMGVADPGVTDMRAAADMRNRKRGLEEAGHAYIALPGGFGTLEEITEMISFKQLGFHNKPIVIVNVNGYFDHLLEQFKLGFKEKFIENRFHQMYSVVETPQTAIESINNYQPQIFDLKYEWPL